MTVSLFNVFLSPLSSMAARTRQVLGTPLGVPAVSRTPGIDSYSARPLALAALMGVLGGGCGAVPSACCAGAEEIDRFNQALYARCEFTEGEPPLAAEERIRARILTLTQQRDSLESEINQSVPRAIQTYDRFIEATAGDAPDFAQARDLVAELQRLEGTLRTRLQRHLLISEEIYDDRSCLRRLFEDDSARLDALLAEEIARIGTRCFRNSDADAMVRRLLENAVERFNGLPGHGEDYDADGPSCPLPSEEPLPRDGS